MKDKRPDFNQEWQRLISTTRQEQVLKEALGTPCPNCGEVHPPEDDKIMVMTFQFSPRISQTELLDGIGDYLANLISSAHFRQQMNWPTDATPAAPDARGDRPAISADDYAKPRYADYAGRPAAFNKAKAAWRQRMFMLGFDPNDLDLS